MATLYTLPTRAQTTVSLAMTRLVPQPCKCIKRIVLKLVVLHLPRYRIILISRFTPSAATASMLHKTAHSRTA